MKNKKGAYEHLNSLILILLFIIIAIAVTKVLYDNYSEEGKIQTCNSWVTFNAIRKGVTLGFTGAEPFAGYQNDQNSGNLYTDNSPCITKRDKITEEDVEEDKVNEKLANNMYNCWRQYGEGKIDFYSNLDFLEAETYCRVCSDITVDEEVEEQEIDITEFEKFVSQKTSPNKVDKYAEYFLGEKGAKLEIGNDDNDKLIINKDKHLYTIFAITKQFEANAETAAFMAYACLKGGELGLGVNGLSKLVGGSATAIKAGVTTATKAGTKAAKKSNIVIPPKYQNPVENVLENKPDGTIITDLTGNVITGAAGAALVAPLIGCGLSMTAVGSTYKAGKIPQLLLYQDDPKNLKNACNSVIINLEKETSLNPFKKSEE